MEVVPGSGSVLYFKGTMMSYNECELWLSQLCYTVLTIIIKKKYCSGIYLKYEPVRTNGVDVELSVQRLRRGGKRSLRAAARLVLHWARWAPDHFLLFFVLHRCIEVEAWDLPWGKSYNEMWGEGKWLQNWHNVERELAGGWVVSEW